MLSVPVQRHSGDAAAMPSMASTMEQAKKKVGLEASKIAEHLPGKEKLDKKA